MSNFLKYYIILKDNINIYNTIYIVIIIYSIPNYNISY